MIKAAIILVTLAAATQPAGAAEPLLLEPSGPWNLRYEDEACQLVRTFGGGDEAVVASFAKYAPGTGIEVRIAGNPLVQGKKALSYRFAPGAPREILTVLMGKNPVSGTVWQFSSSFLPPAAADDGTLKDATSGTRRTVEEKHAQSLTAFEVTEGMERMVSLNTGSLGEAVKLLNTCVDDLVTTWGLDPKVQDAITRPVPKSSPANWVSSRDYPTEQYNADISGSVRFRLAVDTTGKATDCTVQGTFSDPAFAPATCKALMRKARFEPARDSSGAPVASFYAGTVLFYSMTL